jgi:hypothetical protein
MLDWFANNLMQANPDKFQALAIGKTTFKEQICFDLKGSKIKCEEHVKLLGVTIDYEWRPFTQIYSTGVARVP